MVPEKIVENITRISHGIIAYLSTRFWIPNRTGKIQSRFTDSTYYGHRRIINDWLDTSTCMGS